MLLLFILTHILVAVADPFHKYPYVFLLDVGNEEIEKTNTEQIRVSIPGGSLALKYPATEGEDAIAHVRVSGVDFGTDLKANIVEGGPGYKYVVLAFMGNQGVPYDAVVTVETVSNNSEVPNNINDSNDSAEDVSDTNDKPVNESDQSSSNSDLRINYEDAGTYTYSDGTNENDERDDDENENIEKDDEYTDDSNVEAINDKYGKYASFRPLLYGGARIYPQAGAYVEDSNYNKLVYDPENHEGDISEDENDNRYIDSNNNVSVDY